MPTTPLWVPLAVAFVAVLGTLAGVIFTQLWNSRLDEKRWARETERLREAQAREDLNRSYEHRRAAYVEFFQEFDRLATIYTGRNTDREPVNNSAFDSLTERWATVSIYGTYEADQLAFRCQDKLIDWAHDPENGVLADDTYSARAA